jgi:phosphatidylglycerophosphate synthase
MLPLLVFLTIISEMHTAQNSPATRYILTIAFALTFITDAFDGRIARVKKLETYIGKILDSASDYLLLGISAGAFFYFKLIKPWLFLIIIIRLFINAVVMLILSLVNKKIQPQTTLLGKIAIAVIMVLLVLEAAKLPVLLTWIRFAEWAAAFLIGISIIDKIVYLAKGLKAALPQGSAAGTLR